MLLVALAEFTGIGRHKNVHLIDLLRLVEMREAAHPMPVPPQTKVWIDTRLIAVYDVPRIPSGCSFIDYRIA